MESKKCDLESLSDSQSESQLFINVDYSDQFFSELRSLFIKSKFTDVEIICAEKPTEPNSAKDYSNAMFSSNLIESQTNRVFLPNVEFKTLEDVINYAYCGSIYLNVNNVQSVFQLSSLFQTKALNNACCSYMESKLDLTNCIEVHQFAKQHMCDHLVNKSREFISRHFNELQRTREFVEIEDLELLENVLSSDDLEVDTEECVLDGLLKWAKHDLTRRQVHIQRLFSRTIRLGLIEASSLQVFLAENSDILPTVSGLIECQINNEAKKEKPRAGMTKAQQCFLLVGGFPDSCQSNSPYVNCFNPFNGEKYFFSNNFLEQKPYEDKGFFHVEHPGVCVTHDNRVFVAGGLYVFHKNFSNMIPSRLSPHRTNEQDDLRDGEELLSKEMHEYDSKTNTWIKRANMLFTKANLSLCAMNERIYSFGGVSAGQIPLDLVEFYDMNENKWTYFGSMPTPFVAGSVVAYEDKFYVLGGRNGVGSRIISLLKAHPDLIVVLIRFNFGSCVIDDHLYVFGGQRYSESEEHYFTREALDSVEVLDLKSGTGEWTMGPKMPASLYNTGSFVLDEQPGSVYLCGTTECQYSGNTLLGFMFTSVFRLDFTQDLNSRTKLKWSVVEHDVSEVKAYFRCVGARVNSRQLLKFSTNVRPSKSDE